VRFIHGCAYEGLLANKQNIHHNACQVSTYSIQHTCGEEYTMA